MKRTIIIALLVLGGVASFFYACYLDANAEFIIDESYAAFSGGITKTGNGDYFFLLCLVLLTGAHLANCQTSPENPTA